MSKPDTWMPLYIGDSDSVQELKRQLADLLNARGSWVASHKKMIQHQIRAQRLSEARERGTHSKEEWQEILERFEFRCVRCGCYPEPRPCKDHIVPIYLGGSDSADNLQPMCRECNTAKGTDTFNWAMYRNEVEFEDVEP